MPLQQWLQKQCDCKRQPELQQRVCSEKWQTNYFGYWRQWEGNSSIFILGKSLVSLAQEKICWHDCFYRIRFIAVLKMLIIFYSWLTVQNELAASGVYVVNRLGNHRRNNDRVWGRASSAFQRQVLHSQFRILVSHLLLSLLQGIWSNIVLFWLNYTFTDLFSFLSFFPPFFFFFSNLPPFSLSSYKIEKNVLQQNTLNKYLNNCLSRNRRRFVIGIKLHSRTVTS